MKGKRSKWFDLELAVTTEGPTVIRIYGEIAGGWLRDEESTSAAEFQRALDAVPGDLELHINSPGGEVFEGFAIYNQLAAFRAKGRRVTGYVDGSAMSIASVLLMACDRIVMPANSYQMIHFPWLMVVGNAEKLIAAAADLEKLGGTIAEIYATRSGRPVEEIRELLKGAPGADGSFLTADECVELGIADEVAPGVAAAACVGAERWRGVPAALKTEVSATVDTDDYADWCAIVENLKTKGM